MNIIFSREAAQELAKKFIVLELETFKVDNKLLETFCVVSADQIPLAEIPTLEASKKLHDQLIKNLNEKNYNFCLNAIEHLKGKFGGELDSFYHTIEERANNEITSS